MKRSYIANTIDYSIPNDSLAVSEVPNNFYAA